MPSGSTSCSTHSPTDSASWRLRVISALAALGGAALFAWSIRRAGIDAVEDGVRRIGSGFLVVFVLGGLRGLARAAAWRMCVLAEHRPGLATMFAAYAAGDAIGNVTPFGFLISEPSKIVLLRKRIDTPASIAALTIENLFYSAAVVVMLVVGAVALTAFAVPPRISVASAAIVAATIATAIVVGIAATRRQMIGRAFESIATAPAIDRHFSRWLPAVRETGDRLAQFAARSRRALLPVILLEASYHLLAVAEIWFVVGLITGAAPGLLTALVLEYVNRTITVAFQFVPMWLGVDEAGTSLATGILGLGPATGVSLALVRKARIAVWTAIGLAVAIRFSGSQVLARISEPENPRTDEPGDDG
jgi:hypothetical protein